MSPGLQQLGAGTLVTTDQGDQTASWPVTTHTHTHARGGDTAAATCVRCVVTTVSSYNGPKLLRSRRSRSPGPALSARLSRSSRLGSGTIWYSGRDINGTSWFLHQVGGEEEDRFVG